jgi:hypothetical protein
MCTSEDAADSKMSGGRKRYKMVSGSRAIQTEFENETAPR